MPYPRMFVSCRGRIFSLIRILYCTYFLFLLYHGQSPGPAFLRILYCIPFRGRERPFQREPVSFFVSYTVFLFSLFPYKFIYVGIFRIRILYCISFCPLSFGGQKTGMYPYRMVYTVRRLLKTGRPEVYG